MNSKKRIFASIVIFILVIAIGVSGFKILGGGQWSWFDSLYMTVITLSTVGYSEVVDLSANPGARIFAVVFIILCLGTIAIAVTSITGFIIEGELKNILGRKRMEKSIAKLKGHYIVCGTDETAMTVINELLQTKRPFVVIEPMKDRLDQLNTNCDILFIHGDPAEDEVLEQAGLMNADGIILSLPTDEANLFVAVTVRSLNPRIRIVAKGIAVRSHSKMRKAGADAVISPTNIGGMRMVSELVRPAVVSFLDLMLREREKIYRFDEVTVTKGSHVLGKSLGKSGLRDVDGALLVAIRRNGKEDFIFNPSLDTEINEGDDLIFIVTADARKTLEKKIKGK